MTALSPSWFEDESPRDLFRWAAAAAVVLGIHAGAIAFYLFWHQPEEEIGDDAVVVTVELAPIELDAGRRAARCRAGARDHDRIKGRSRTAKGEADRRGEGRAAAG